MTGIFSARALVALIAALALAGCGSDTAGTSGDSTGTPASAGADEHNAADVTFLQMMIPHHAQAIEMSDLILGADGISDDVGALAERVEAAQQPEIDQMTVWLEAWGEDVPATGSAMAMDHPMNGMLAQEEVDAIGAASGSDAARLYLEGLRTHHEGAIEMAKDEVATGASPQVLNLAQTIITTQQAEVTEIGGLLAAV